MITFEAPARFSQLFGGVAVGPEDGPRPEHIRHGDRRGHEAGDAERGALEARYEELLEAAEKQSRESMVDLRVLTWNHLVPFLRELRELQTAPV